MSLCVLGYECVLIHVLCVFLCICVCVRVYVKVVSRFHGLKLKVSNDMFRKWKDGWWGYEERGWILSESKAGSVKPKYSSLSVNPARPGLVCKTVLISFIEIVYLNKTIDFWEVSVLVFYCCDTNYHTCTVLCSESRKATF